MAAGSTSSSLVLLGRIAGAHGIRGEVLIKTFTAAPEDIGGSGGRFVLSLHAQAAPRKPSA
jgi:ribosomal 30S subunit maturation factor RimM